MPVCEKNLPYELTVSFLLTADAPGMPKPIKLQEQHRAMFPLGKPITEESGRLVAAWAAGGKAPAKGSKADWTPLSDEEFAALMATLDVKTRPALVRPTTPGRGPEGSRRESQFAAFKAERDGLLKEIEGGR